MDAIRAHQRPSHLSVEIGFDPLKIGPPNPFRLVVGMADIVPDGAPLAANGTDSSHKLVLNPFNDF